MSRCKCISMECEAGTCKVSTRGPGKIRFEFPVVPEQVAYSMCDGCVFEPKAIRHDAPLVERTPSWSSYAAHHTFDRPYSYGRVRSQEVDPHLVYLDPHLRARRIQGNVLYAHQDAMDETIPQSLPYSLPSIEIQGVPLFDVGYYRLVCWMYNLVPFATYRISGRFHSSTTSWQKKSDAHGILFPLDSQPLPVAEWTDLRVEKIDGAGSSPGKYTFLHTHPYRADQSRLHPDDRLRTSEIVRQKLRAFEPSATVMCACTRSLQYDTPHVVKELDGSTVIL